MCGIFGIWNRDGRPVDLDQLRCCTNRLRHRGPDDEGYLLVNTRTGATREFGGTDTVSGLDLAPLEAAAGSAFDLAFGHRRLAILDLSEAGHQPMASFRRDLWLVYNGEIYNYVELRQQLGNLGHTFRSGTDTEVILAAYQQWGADCVSHFNGMWAFALYDTAKRALLCSRDRFGIKPFHFVERGATFAFGSEIKALVGGAGAPFEPDAGAIARFVGFGVHPSARAGDTFFANVHALPPATNFAVSETSRVASRYYRTEIDGEGEDASQGVIEQFRELLIDSVRLQLRSDVTVGSCLSGGLDSSSIVAAATHLLETAACTRDRHRLRTFSSVFEEEAPYNERPFIDAVLGRVPARGVLVYPTAADLEEHIDEVVHCQDEPFGDLSIFAQWFVMRSAKEAGVGVLLDGQGADELLGGYAPFTTFVTELLERRKVAAATREFFAFRRIAGGSLMRMAGSLLIRKLAPRLQESAARRRLRASLGLRLVCPDLRTSPDLFVNHDHAGTLYSLSALLRYQMEEGVLPALLRYEDRNSSAFGLEARVPFLDHRLVDFVFKKAAAHRIRNGWTKYALRSAFSENLPDEVVWRRKKVGFGVPGAAWADHLTECGLGSLGPHSPAHDYLDMANIGRLQAKPGGNLSAAAPLWRCQNLDLWLRSWGPGRVSEVA